MVVDECELWNRELERASKSVCCVGCWLTVGWVGRSEVK